MEQVQVLEKVSSDLKTLIFVQERRLSWVEAACTRTWWRPSSWPDWRPCWRLPWTDDDLEMGIWICSWCWIEIEVRFCILKVIRNQTLLLLLGFDWFNFDCHCLWISYFGSSLLTLGLKQITCRNMNNIKTPIFVVTIIILVWFILKILWTPHCLQHLTNTFTNTSIPVDRWDQK